MAKVKFTRITTPKGIAVFPHLHAPDTKFDADGVYTVKLRLTAEEAAPVIEAIQRELPKAQELLDAAKDKEKAKNKLKDYSINEEPWVEEEDGSIVFSFKMNAKVTSKKDGKTYDLKPAIFDAHLRPVAPGTRVGGGSIIRVSVDLVPYFMASNKTAGVSLRLIAVQVIEMRSFSQDASAFGFGEEDGGFDATEGGADAFGEKDQEDTGEDEEQEDEGDDDEEGDF